MTESVRRDEVGDEVVVLVPPVGGGDEDRGHRGTGSGRGRGTRSRLHSWEPIGLVSAAADPPVPPEIVGLFYPGCFHLLSGESEALKTWLAGAAASTELVAGRGVLWVDGDDVGEGAMLERLRLLGVDDDPIEDLFLYVCPDEPFDEDRRTDVLAAVKESGCRLAVLDGFNPLLGLHGLDPNSGTDVELFYRLFDPIRKLGVATVITDNVVKSRENRGAWAIGSERKKSKADVQLGMRALEPLVRGGRGRARIDVHKDRPGHLLRPSPGLFVIESDETGLSWRIQQDESHDEAGEFRPTKLMEKVSRFLEGCDEAQSRNRIESATQGKAEYVRMAIDCLVREGYATELEGARNARLVRLERAFREADDDVSDFGTSVSKRLFEVTVPDVGTLSNGAPDERQDREHPIRSVEDSAGDESGRLLDPDSLGGESDASGREEW